MYNRETSPLGSLGTKAAAPFLLLVPRSAQLLSHKGVHYLSSQHSQLLEKVKNTNETIAGDTDYDVLEALCGTIK